MKKLIAYLCLLLVVVVLMVAYGRRGKLSPSPAAKELAPARGQTEAPASDTSSESSQKLPVEIDQSLEQEARAAMDRASKWLAARQAEDGSFSNPEFPALTGLALWGMLGTGNADPAVVEKAVNYILSCVREDGSIWRDPSEERKGGGLSNYNTAICMVALHATGRADLRDVILKARRFIAGTQHFGEDVYSGGMGYDADTGRPYADLSNSYLAYEAMRLTESVEEMKIAHGNQNDLEWESAQEFLNRVQNNPDVNTQSWASADEQEKGGFAYHPEKSMAGSYSDTSGVERLRSYGSMTYAGLLSFIYAEVDREDPRVQSAFEWCLRNWNLDENPGMGKEGLFYYYQTLAKALAVFGQDTLHLEDGGNVNWREALSRKLISLQKVDPDGTGFWVNDEGRWWEADPVLATSYSLIALSTAVPR